jgi:hypothetical protein
MSSNTIYTSKLWSLSEIDILLYLWETNHTKDIIIEFIKKCTYKNDMYMDKLDKSMYQKFKKDYKYDEDINSAYNLLLNLRDK